MTGPRTPLSRGSWLIAWLLCTVASLAIFARPRAADINIDEIYWIGSSYYYHLAFDRWDWSHPDWKMMSARENPPVAKYAIGLSLAAHGQHVVHRDMIGCFRVMFPARPSNASDFPDYPAVVADIGDVTLADCARPLGGPGVTRKGEILYLARKIMVVCAVLTSLVLFLFGSSIANRATGLLASQLILVHPIIADAYNHAMADAVMLMFSVAGALLTWRVFERVTRPDEPPMRGTIGLVAAAAVTMGLACAAKMNALVVVMLFGASLSVAAALLWRRGLPRRALRALALGAAGGAITAATFVLVNPALLVDFPAALFDLFGLQTRGLAYTVSVMPELRLTSLGQKVNAVAFVSMGLLPWLPAATFYPAAAFAFLAAVKWPRPGVWFVSGWLALCLIVVTWWIPIGWPRYVVPVIAPFLLLLSCAIVAAVTHLVQFAAPRVRSDLAS
jgi:hypothetical protein